MELRQIARSLGIAEYPAAFDRVYANLSQTNADICSIDRITALQQEMNLLGEHYDAVLDAVRTLQQDSARLCWGQVVSTYLSDASLEEAQAVPLPVAEGDGDPLPLLILLTQIPSAIEGYRSRGFSMEAIQETLTTFQRCVERIRDRTGVTGLDLRFYRWLCLYIKCRIFAFDGFEFEIRSFPGGCVVLKNRETGTLVPLMDQVTLHESGMILGSAGCEDPKGAREVVFEETANGFRGCPAIRGKADGPVVFYYPKTRWSVALRPGDAVLSIHLPKGVDLSAQHLDSAFSRVQALVRQYYPEAHIRAFHCGSWLLDPQLADILGPDSKIAQFAARFALIPLKSAGREVYNFVFPPNITDLNALPENTRLERGLKKLYLSGGYIYAFAGVFL